MDAFLTFVLVLTTLLNAGAALAAWIAKIRWSDEFARAKDETIRAKEAQITYLDREIKSLQDLNPIILKEWHKSVNEQLSEIIAELKERLDAANKERQKAERQVELYKLELEKEVQRLTTSEPTVIDIKEAKNQVFRYITNIYNLSEINEKSNKLLYSEIDKSVKTIATVLEPITTTEIITAKENIRVEVDGAGKEPFNDINDETAPSAS